MKSSLITASALTALLSTGAFSEDKRGADAHQHGHGVLNVALEGETLSIELETPGADILGFEYEAESEEDRATVKKARETLSDPVSLFGLSDAAGCSVTDADIEIGADETDHDDDHHDDDHHGDEHAEKDHDGHDDHHDKEAHTDEHDHEEEHNDEHDHEEEHADKDDHDDEHDHDDHADEGENHSEVHAHYTLTCDAPAKITSLDLGAFFKAFPNAEELDAALLTDNGQAGGEITPASPTLTF